MAWLNIRFPVTAADAETLSDALALLGALSVSVGDAAAGTAGETPIYGEPGSAPALVEDALWRYCDVTALFPSECDPAALAKAAAQVAGLAATPQFSGEWVEETDWVRTTQAQFEPIRITDRLWIVPTWHQAPDPRACNIRLDPGAAFGTGSHPTTRLCLQWLEENIRGGESLLDYGCGSGILAIAGKRLGAGAVTGIDIDPQAVAAARYNADLNGVDVRFREPSSEKPTQAQMVVANILANSLQVLAPLLAGCTGRAGRIALSGILSPQAEAVMLAYRPWFAMDVYRHDSDWVCLQGERLP